MPDMETLIALGHWIAPFAMECTVKISVVALAALLAVKLLGRRQSARSFSFTVAAFALGALLLFSSGVVRTEVPLADRPFSERTHAPDPLTETDGPIATAAPGLMTKYGSMFQARFSGHFSKEEPGQAAPSRRTSRDWISAVGFLWLLGFAAVSGHHLLGILALEASLSASRPCEDRRLLHMATRIGETLDTCSVELRLGPAGRAPFLAGVVHPRVILPEDATGWSEERLASTLLHEYMHVKRFDVPIAEALRLLASLAWFSPLPWLALSSALRLREEACDEAVLRAGVAPAKYAADLLATARSLSRSTPAMAAISGGSELEHRIRAILEGPILRSRWDTRMRNAAAALILSAAVGATPIAAPFYALFDSASVETRPLEPSEWIAASDPLTSPAEATPTRGAFSLEPDGGYVRIRLRFAGRTTVHRLPTAAMPCAIPLTSKARMIMPFGDLLDTHSQRPFLNPGWTVWDDREVPVKAAAPGRVIVAHVDSRYGPIVEVDHGSGFRTRYGFGRHGASSVHLGEFVAAGTTLGTFGDFSPLDIPSLNFGVLLQLGGRLITLDPAPFLFASEANRRTPLGASVLNASIRIEDLAEVRRLIASGVSVNGGSADGTLPLEWAILVRNLAIARDLVAAGADPGAATWDTHQPYIALHGPSIAEIARETADPALIALLSPDRPPM